MCVCVCVYNGMFDNYIIGLSGNVTIIVYYFFPSPPRADDTRMRRGRTDNEMAIAARELREATSELFSKTKCRK